MARSPRWGGQSRPLGWEAKSHWHGSVPCGVRRETSAWVTVEGEGWRAGFACAAAVVGSHSAASLALGAGRWASQWFPNPPPVLYADQRHTNLIYAYAKARELTGQPHCVGVCDGLLTAEPGVVLTVRTADCVPVVLAGGGVIAVLHCGWRSLAGDIVGRALARFAGEYGVAAPGVQAIIGVGIGPCHYPVGEEVLTALSVLPVADASWRMAGRVDLAAWIRGRLERLGVTGGAIQTLPGCTACSPDYHSFRRDGPDAGRQWTAAVLI